MERSRVENATWTLTPMSAPRIRLKGHQFHEISGFPVLPPRHLPDDPAQTATGPRFSCHRFGIAAPAVVRWIFHHPGPHRIQVNIRRHRP